MQLADKDARISEMEKRMKEAEDRTKTLDRTLKDNKDRVEELKKEVKLVLVVVCSLQSHVERPSTN